MADFETMPIGTRDAIRETAWLLRQYEKHHREAVTTAATALEHSQRIHKADRNAQAAQRLEQLLEHPGVGQHGTLSEVALASRRSIEEGARIVGVDEASGSVMVRGEQRDVEEFDPPVLELTDRYSAHDAEFPNG